MKSSEKVSSIQKLKELVNFLLSAGTSPENSKFRNQTLRVANINFLTVTLNTTLFVLIFAWYGIVGPFVVSLVALFAYLSAYWLMWQGRPVLARSLLLIYGALVLFFGAAYVGEQAKIQVMLFAVTVSAMILFDWKESKYAIALAVFPIALFVLGENTNYFASWFPRYPGEIPYREVEILTVTTSIFNCLAGLFYFRKQIRNHQLEIEEYVQRLKDEHQKQMHAHKMASLGEMAGGMAHEINTPLTAISIRVYQMKRLLQEKPLDPEQQKNFIQDADRILETIQRISKIIAALRIVARTGDQDPFERIDLAEVAENTLELSLQRFKEAGIELRVDVPRGLMTESRPTQLSQVLLNLVNNAFDATAGTPGSWVRIEAREYGGELLLSVTNSGPTISPQLASRIFEPFFTTKRPGHGTGLGLSISKGLIEAHHGSLEWLPEAPNTTFQIRLPKVQPGLTRAALRSKTSEQRTTG